MSSVDDETIMDVLTESDAPRLTTTEVAGELPLARGTVRSRLQALADEGRLEREREGRDVVWFLPDRGDEPAPEPETNAEAEAGDDEETDERADAEEEAERAVSDDEDEHEHEHEREGEPTDDEDGDEPEPDERTEGVADEPTDEAAAAGTPPITEQGETVTADLETGRPAASEVSGGPLDRVDRDRLVRAATAAVLLAAVYAAFRRIRGGS